MKLITQMRFLERIDHLIRTKATGTPEQLSKRLEISTRKLFRIIAELRTEGFPIAYCKERCCYFYEEKVEINFEIHIKGNTLLKIKGGKKYIFFDGVTFFGSEAAYICT